MIRIKGLQFRGLIDADCKSTSASCGLRPFPLLKKGNLMQAWGLASLILWEEVQTFWMGPSAFSITKEG